VSEVFDETRQRSREEGTSSADVFADRAFAAVVLRTLGGVADVGADAGRAAAQRWANSRGTSRQDLVAEFAGDVFRQLASHYSDREAGTLVESGRSATSTADVTATLADRVGGVVARVWKQSASGESWSTLVGAAIAEGATLPERG
jgi:hypothetical protein